MKESPRISVVVATFNASTTLRRCLESILSQDYDNKEILVIDGASTDGTAELISSFGSRLTYWESSRDNGVYDAWNKAIAKVGGEWIVFLGADDYYPTTAQLSQFAPYLASASERGTLFVYGRLLVLDALGNLHERAPGPWAQVSDAFERWMITPHVGAFCHRDAFRRYGGFDQSFQIAGDYEFLRRFLPESDAEYVPCIQAVMSEGGMSSSLSSAPRMFAEMRRVWKLHPPKRPLRTRAAFGAQLKRCRAWAVVLVLKVMPFPMVEGLRRWHRRLRAGE